MKYDGIKIRQYKNQYALYNQNCILIMRIMMPNDGQFIRDHAMLQAICHVLAYRYGILEKKKDLNRMIEYIKGGVHYEQVARNEFNVYAIALPTGEIVCVLRTPLDGAYIEDGIVCETISANIAIRFGLVDRGKFKSKKTRK